MISDDIKLVADCIFSMRGGDSEAYKAFERLMTERSHMLDNLTATQARCTELFEEMRKAKGTLKGCFVCKGTGYVGEECFHCHGSGWEPSPREE